MTAGLCSQGCPVQTFQDHHAFAHVFRHRWAGETDELQIDYVELRDSHDMRPTVVQWLAKVHRERQLVEVWRGGERRPDTRAFLIPCDTLMPTR